MKKSLFILLLSAFTFASAQTPVTLQGGDLTVEDMDGIMNWSASCPGYQFYMMISSYELEGTFDQDTWIDEQCFVGDETTGNAYYFVSGSVTVEQTELGSYWMHGTVTAHEGSVFVLDLLSPVGLKYDEQRTDFSAYFDLTEVQVDDRKWADFSGLTLVCQNSSNQVAVISFVCDKEQADEDILLPLGEYTVSNSKEPFTVTPSIGVFGGEVYSSFAGNLVSTGIDYPVWMLASGIVTVSKEDGEPRVMITALNSCYRRITIQIGGENVLPVENIIPATTATKRFVEGQLLLLTPYGTFDILGRKH